MNLSVIKTLCETKNVKFKDLCNVIGITDAGLYKAINNNKISAEYLEKIADYFGVSVGVFFGDTNVTSAIDSIRNAFERDLNDIKEYWNFLKQNIKMLVVISGMNEEDILDYNLSDLEDNILPVGKRKEFKKMVNDTLDNMLDYMGIIDTKIKKTPSMVFLKSLTTDEIKKLYMAGLLSKEVAMFIMNFQDFLGNRTKKFNGKHSTILNGTLREYFNSLLSIRLPDK